MFSGSTQPTQSPKQRMIEQNINISLLMDEKYFIKTFNHNFEYSFENVESTLFKQDSITADFKREALYPINKYLAENKFQNRFYKLSNRLNDEVFAISFLNFNQAVLFDLPYEIFKDLEEYNYPLAKGKIDSTIYQMEVLGLFSHLSKKEILEGKKQASELSFIKQETIFYCFPMLSVKYDGETKNLKNPYEELCQKLKMASNGIFSPTNIRDQFEEDYLANKAKTKVKFEFKGKSYETELKLNSNFLDDEFIDFVNKSLNKEKVDGQFYYVQDFGQTLDYIFLTNKQFDFLEKNMSLIFPYGFFD